MKKFQWPICIWVCSAFLLAKKSYWSLGFVVWGDVVLCGVRLILRTSLDLKVGWLRILILNSSILGCGNYQFAPDLLFFHYLTSFLSWRCTTCRQRWRTFLGRCHRLIQFCNWWRCPLSLLWRLCGWCCSDSCFAFGVYWWFCNYRRRLRKCQRRREFSCYLGWLCWRCGYDYFLGFCGKPHSQSSWYVRVFRWYTTGIDINFLTVSSFLRSFIFCLASFVRLVIRPSVVFPVGSFGSLSA